MEKPGNSLENVLNNVKTILEFVQKSELFRNNVKPDSGQFLNSWEEVFKSFRRYTQIGRMADENTMVALVNQERISHGLPILAIDSRLIETARIKSQDMINHSYFGHHSPALGSLGDIMAMHKIQYRSAAENLAGNNDVKDAHLRLMDSLKHRKNILNKNFVKIGVGIVYGGPYGMMITQHYII
ncbi:MAG: CAP domain-containing protein [Dehalobacterium sp.]